MLHRTIQELFLIGFATLYVIGNNQIADADTITSTVSRASIVFDQAYTPQPNIHTSPVIPDGHLVVSHYGGSGQLPRTGEQSGMGWEVLGASFLLASLSITIKKQKS